MKLVSVSEMIAIEQESALNGIPPVQLMESAGLAVALKTMDLAGNITSRNIIVLVGPGNNGGDALVAARHLACREATVKMVIPVSSPSNQANLQLALEAGAGLVNDFSDLQIQLADADICLDGFFGTGRSRPIGGDYKSILHSVNSVKARRGGLLTIAIDVPSGIDGDTGAVDPEAFIADYTLTLGYPKLGLYNCDSAVTVVGEIAILDIGIPADIGVAADIELVDWRKAIQIVPRRPMNAHKGTSGRLLVVAGSDRYPGAAFLSAAGAIRSGAGLVTLAIHRSLQGAIVSLLPEATYLPLDELTPGIISSQAASMAQASLEGYAALLAGCGMGQTRESGELICSLVKQVKKYKLPFVLDADGLNILATTPGCFKSMPPGGILTPHPGEMGRLCGLNIAQIQSDRIGITSRKAREWNQVIVLKGAYTVIASYDGQVKVNPYPNPALASAGTGDVLAGIISGLLAQGLKSFDAAWLGVYLHSRAGIEAARDFGSIGVLASDLLPLLPIILKSLAEPIKLEE